MVNGNWYVQGRIIQCKFDWPSHSKWAVLLGETKDRTHAPILLFIWFNSEISDNTRNKKGLLELQVPVNNNDYEFLTQPTGFIDCARIRTKSYYELCSEFDGYSEEIAVDCGNLALTHWQEVFANVLKSPLLNEQYEHAIREGL